MFKFISEELHRLDPPFEPPADLFWEDELNDVFDRPEELLREEEDDQNNKCDGGGEINE